MNLFCCLNSIFCTFTFPANALSGTARSTATAPLDRISTVMRAGSSVHTANNAGIFRVTTSLIRTGGLRSLWNGNGVMCTGYGPEGALQIFIVGYLKNLIAKDPTKPTVMEKFIIGGLSGWMAMTAIYPNYLLQTRMTMADPGRFNGFLDATKKTIATDGLRRGLFSGYAACTLRRFPEVGINFALYQVLKDAFVEQGKDASILQILLFGSTTALIQKTIVFPLSTVHVSQGPPITLMYSTFFYISK